MIVFVKNTLIEGGFVERAYSELDDCMVLLLKSSYLNIHRDIILLYLSPEGSLIYSDKTGFDGIDK